MKHPVLFGFGCQARLDHALMEKEEGVVVISRHLTKLHKGFYVGNYLSLFF